MKKPLPKFFPSRIVATFERADRETLLSGLTWYDRAQALARELDPVNPARAAGVIAALSPQKSWGQNVKLARRAYATGKVSGHVGVMVRQAQAILDGADPWEVLQGPKVRAFASCIMGDASAVCVDRHAVDVARGRRGANSDPSILGRVGAYDKASAAYRTAARELSRRLGFQVLAYQVQAVTWVQWRIEHGTGQD